MQLNGGRDMKRLMIVALMSAFAMGSAWAQDTCVSKAVDKSGKPLAGAAKTSSIKKCCEAAAVDKNGKPLSGAAKASSVKKCEEGA
jgi:hypothetical protein